MNVFMSKFMTYFEIHRMHRDGHSIRKISEYLVLNRRTVSKYLSMCEQEYEAFLMAQSQRKKKLLPYEGFVKERLEQYRDTPAAQMHDWLKEHHPDFPKISQKTVFNFVFWVRERHRLPIIKEQRLFQQQEETPYGEQSQVDFGEYKMRTTDGTRVKVYFFTIVLSRSRYRYVWFTDRPFTTRLAIIAHENSFAYFEGIPNEVVYDQDKVFIISENAGDIILTNAFRSYTREQSFNLYFCRKSDPQSKGMVENLVKYVKQNFLYNRTFYDIDTLNTEVLGWLIRTANGLPHAVTQKEPFAEHMIEKPFLKPYKSYVLPVEQIATYTVRKDHTISYKGNFYSLPLGTFKGKGTFVAIQKHGNTLIINDAAGKQEICRHSIPVGRGNKVINNHHKRDNTSSITEMVIEVTQLFEDPERALDWLEMIKGDKPRYIRDQLTLIKRAALKTDKVTLTKAMEYCLTQGIYSAADFKSLLATWNKNQETKSKVVQLNPLNGKLPDQAHIQPNTSSIADFEKILNNSKTKS